MNNDTEKTGNWTLLSKSLLSVNFQDAYEQNLAATHKNRARLSVKHGKCITIARATKSLFLTRQNIRSESINILMRAEIEWKMKSGVEFLALPAMGCLNTT